jgi:acyl-CoA reductase-like NAD-dependent aldehyde dehydrogenase
MRESAFGSAGRSARLRGVSSTTVSGSDQGVATIEVRSPVDGRVLERLSEDTGEDVERIARRLRDAQPAWEELGVRARARWLGIWRDWLLDNQDRLTELIRQETGKALGDASIEVPTTVETINYFIRHAEGFLADERPRPHSPAFLTKRLRLRRRPHQLVGLIEPWNFPLALPAFDGIPALIAGCSLLTKPSEVVPLSWREAVRGWEEVGAPPVIACVTGGPSVGAAVVDAVDMIHFTGSTATGRAVAKRAAERLIPCNLELGGKDPMIVLADADIERAAAAAVWGGLFNSGQACISVERIYVEEPVYDTFVEEVVKRVSALRQGPEARPYSIDIGAMATEAQVEIVREQVEDAVTGGARVLLGGHRHPGDGRYFEPTVLVDVDHDMACMRKETFGPLLPIMRVADAEEAIRLANDTSYGLSASVFSRDRRRAEWVAERLEAGAVNLNNVIVNGFQFPLPMGGWKESGIGARAGGAAAVRKYCRAQAIVSDRIEPRNDISWYPYTPLKGAIQARAMRLLGGRDVRRRLGLGGRYRRPGS